MRAVAQGRGTQPHHAVVLLAAQRSAIERRLQRLSGGITPPWPTAVRESLLELELRCKIEEQLLFPALFEARNLNRSCDDGGIADEEAELRLLRDLADKTQHSMDQPAGQRVLFAALQGAAALHFDAVELLIAESADSGAVDWPKLGHQMNALLKRWREELEETGDIEDEERDPVGLPPR